MENYSVMFTHWQGASFWFFLFFGYLNDVASPEAEETVAEETVIRQKQFLNFIVTVKNLEIF